MKKIKHLISKIVRSLGYELRKTTDAPEINESEILNALLFTLLSTQKKLSLVEIGANDGVTNDPLFEFMKKHGDQCEITLIEPLPELIPILQNNYSFQEHKKIINCAIGPKTTIKMWKIKRSIWPYLQVPYAKEWPEYRAPTGVTSSNKDHVAKWLKNHLTKDVPIESALEAFEIESLPLTAALNLTDNNQIDYLQVDTEGFDDVVLYNCDLIKTKPRIVWFEYGHLPPSRQTDLESHLHNLGYVIIKLNHNSVAILTK